MHIHLDVIGGISGDMFCAAMLDTFPELATPLNDFINGLPFLARYKIDCKPAKQKAITGKRFCVLQDNVIVEDRNHIVFTPLLSTQNTNKIVIQNHSHSHHHHSWADIKAKILLINDNDIQNAVLQLYQTLIDAESKVHGIAPENIHLHEVGSDDALIDMTSAAFLVLRSLVKSWSFSPLPWGNGTIQCAHGTLPVPAPATIKILKNFAWQHDSEMGERITPTGATILAWLAQWKTQGPQGQLVAEGYGCGKRQFANTANILRATLFKQSITDNETTDTVEIVQFDIDDMTAEMLAIAQQKLRDQNGVIDLSSYAINGKKGRIMIRTELLCSPVALDAIYQSIFNLTTTLGIRHWQSKRKKLIRTHQTVDYQQRTFPVKTAIRPNSITAKVEADSLASVDSDFQQLAKLKFTVEQIAVDRFIQQPVKTHNKE